MIDIGDHSEGFSKKWIILGERATGLREIFLNGICITKETISEALNLQVQNIVWAGNIV